MMHLFIISPEQTPLNRGIDFFQKLIEQFFFHINVFIPVQPNFDRLKYNKIEPLKKAQQNKKMIRSTRANTVL